MLKDIPEAKPSFLDVAREFMEMTPGGVGRLPLDAAIAIGLHIGLEVTRIDPEWAAELLRRNNQAFWEYSGDDQAVADREFKRLIWRFPLERPQ